MADGKSRVLIAGLGDIGLLTAIHLARHVDVVGVSSKPELVSGQELGVRRVHGVVTGVDLDAREVTVELAERG